MEYVINYKIEARFHAIVQAESLEEAKSSAQQRYCDADFGEAEDINGEYISAEDIEGNVIEEV